MIVLIGGQDAAYSRPEGNADGDAHRNVVHRVPMTAPTPMPTEIPMTIVISWILGLSPTLQPLAISAPAEDAADAEEFFGGRKVFVRLGTGEGERRH